ncbi:radical SAM protein [candidate division KSB1 bacterium]|nr:radical SAM protein [candidate division KSB1 bacterium]
MLKVNEIFHSIQGESTYAGIPCAFIRLTGCNLRCTYCDTKYAYEDGSVMSLQSIVDTIQRYNCRFVEITGGEPLQQAETSALAQALLDRDKTVLVETNGTLDIRCLPEDVIRIIDLKCPGSGESDKIFWQNFEHLKNGDQVKCVIANRLDFDWAIDAIQRCQLFSNAVVLFAPVFDQLAVQQLARWILQSGLPIRLQIQLHKYIWSPTRRGV